LPLLVRSSRIRRISSGFRNSPWQRVSRPFFSMRRRTPLPSPSHNHIAKEVGGLRSSALTLSRFPLPILCFAFLLERSKIGKAFINHWWRDSVFPYPVGMQGFETLRSRNLDLECLDSTEHSPSPQAPKPPQSSTQASSRVFVTFGGKPRKFLELDS
jgi:hypothetical protein